MFYLWRLYIAIAKIAASSLQPVLTLKDTTEFIFECCINPNYPWKSLAWRLQRSTPQQHRLDGQSL